MMLFGCSLMTQSVYFPVEINNMPEIYRISQSKTTERYENLIPIYWQVVSNANVQASRLARKMGGKLVRIKTDSILAEDPNDVYLEPSEIGGYKIEPLKGELNVSPLFINDYKYTRTFRDWNKTNVSSSGMLITGLAGTGKSFTVKKLVESIGKEKCALLATT